MNDVNDINYYATPKIHIRENRILVNIIHMVQKLH